MFVNNFFCFFEKSFYPFSSKRKAPVLGAFERGDIGILCI